MALSFKQQLNILSRGVETVVHECDRTSIIHYHFVGAPFRGLVTNDIAKKREAEKRERILNVKPKRKQEIALKLSFNDEEGWKMVYELAELSIAEINVIEEVIKKQRIFRYNRRNLNDNYNPSLYIQNIDDELAFDAECRRSMEELAKQRNRLMHASNGNTQSIIQAGDVYVHDGKIITYTQNDIDNAIEKQMRRCTGEIVREINYTILLNELDQYINRKVTIKFDAQSGHLSMEARDFTHIVTGKGKNKRIKRDDASYKMLYKLLSTHYINILGKLDMKLMKIFPVNAIMQSNIKENTKRDNKTHKNDGKNRVQILQNKGLDKYAKNLEVKQEYNRLQRIYAIQRKQESNSKDKIIAQLQMNDGARLEWSIPVSIQFEEFQSFLSTIEDLFNDDVKRVYNLASICNSLYLLQSNPDMYVKWNACDNLRRALGIKCMSLALFASYVVHLFRHFGFITQSFSHPHLQSYDSQSTLSILITLILTIIYRNDPKQSTVGVLVNSCKDLPLASRGVGLLEDVVKRVCNYVVGTENLDDMIPNKLKYIEEKIIEFGTKEGLLKLSTEEKSFVEICQLRCDIIALSSCVDTRSVYYQKYLTLKAHVNNMYTIAQRSPVAGCGRRKKPVVFHVWGAAGIGKSRIIKLIAADTISTILSLEGYEGAKLDEAIDTYDQFIYYRPVGVQYEQNFVSSRAKIYVCDDANQVDAKHLQHGTPFPQALIHLANEHDHMLPVAELDMKAQALFKSSLIIATDNNQTPDLSYLQCPEAYHRRIDFSFKMVLKADYSKLVKNSLVVDISKLDVNQSNEHIYEFHSGNQIYSYNEVVSLVRMELRSVHNRFIDETVIFKRRAQVSRQKMIDTEPVKAYVADNFQNVERPASNRLSGFFNRHNAPLRSNRTISPLNFSAPSPNFSVPPPPIPSTSQDSNLISFEQPTTNLNIPPPDFSVPPPLIPSTSQEANSSDQSTASLQGFFDNSHKPIGVIKPTYSVPGLTRNIFSSKVERIPFRQKIQVFLITYVFIYLPVSWSSTLNEFFFGRTEKAKKQRGMVLLTIGLLITSFAAYKIYKRCSSDEAKKKKKSVNKTKIEALEQKKKQLEIEIQKELETETDETQKYNDGQPKTVKSKDKTPSKEPIVVVPIFKSELQNKTKDRIDVLDYVNSSQTQLKIPQAYMSAKMILQNMYVLILEYKCDGVWKYGILRGFFLSDRSLITNRHFLSLSDEQYKTANISLFNPFNTYLNIKTSQISVLSFAHSDEMESLYYDLIVLNFDKGSGVKSHIDLTMQHSNESNFIPMAEMPKLIHQDIMLVSLVDDVEFEKINDVNKMKKNTQWLLSAEKQYTTVTSINDKPMQAVDPNGELLYTWKTISYTAQTIPGSCGSAIISNSSNHAGKIVGIHMAGFYLSDSAFGQLISYEMIQAIKPFCQMKYKPGVIRTILPNDFPIISTIPRPLFMPEQTKLRHSICFEEIEKTRKAPAKLKYGKNEEHGAVTAIRKYLNPRYSLDDEDRAICKAYMEYCFRPIREIKSVSKEVAIRGIEGNKYIQAINRVSSAGYPLAQETKKPGKTEFLGAGEEFIYDHPRLNELLSDIEKCVNTGKRPDIYFSVTMKDELRKTDKLLARIFAAGPLQYTILFRQYYIDYFAATMENRIFNTSLIGINMLSSDVNVLVEHLTSVAHPKDKAFLAGDFKNFDGTLMTCLLWEVYETIEKFYNRDNNRFTQALWLEITDSRQIFGNAVAHIAAGQPSGNPATTFVNTMYNTSLLYLIISKILKNKNTPEAFEIFSDLTKHIRIVTYGDDNLMSFSLALRKILDPREITEMMTTFGHTYTNDAKDGKELEYKTLAETSILKRTFSYDEKHGYIAPLELTSILECLNWDKVKPEQRELKRAQTIVNMRVAIRELSLHTQQIFEEYRQRILTSAKRHKLDLPPECMFTQRDLRDITLCSDNLFYFSDDFNVVVDQKLRQGIYSEHDENSLIDFHELWPVLEMKQWSAEQTNENQSQEVTNQQILTYDKETTFIEETMPAQKDISEEKFFQFEEIRDHTVRDIISRVYTIADITVPTGGLPGDILYSFDPLSALLSQTNVKAKLSKFGAIRANIVIRTLITTARTCSGAIMPQYIPPLGTQRAATLLQQSQAIREVVPLSTGSQIDILAPWVDAFLARNLNSNTGSLGTFRISRVTPSQTDSFKLKIQIFCPKESLRVEYPTFIDQVVTLNELKIEKERIDQLMKRMEARPQINVVQDIPRMQMNSVRNIISKLTSSLPRHDPPSTPITAVKWQPGMGMLNDEATIPIHSLTVEKQQGTDTVEGQFGSKIDEMDVETIMNSKNIIGVFPVNTSDAVHQVLYARPCTITDFIGSTSGTPPVTTMSISHQMFVASMAQQWSAKLNFSICGTHNQLHSYQLRSIFVPEDTGKYTVGQIMSMDDVNTVKGQVHKFGADKMIGEHVVEPMATTNMKNVPCPRNAASIPSLATLTANQYTHECSYGMFYIILEVPLIASAQVSSTVYLYIDFHASDVILSEAETWLYLLPQTQMKGIEGESFEQHRSKTKSQIIERGESAYTIGKMPSVASTITQSLGERINNLKQLATAATVFSNSFTTTAAQAYLINPFIFRTTLSQLQADRGQYSDHIDYLYSAFGFSKGGMLIYMGKRVSANDPLGEALLVNPRNNYTLATITTPNGIQTISAPNSASSGSRVQPLYAEECLTCIHVPYLQPFNINRVTSTDSFNSGSNRKSLLIRPFVATNARFYRAAARDFTLGFLTSLPQYTLNIAPSVYT